jgi:hypothetical protein
MIGPGSLTDVLDIESLIPPKNTINLVAPDGPIGIPFEAI